MDSEYLMNLHSEDSLINDNIVLYLLRTLNMLENRKIVLQIETATVVPHDNLKPLWEYFRDAISILLNNCSFIDEEDQNNTHGIYTIELTIKKIMSKVTWVVHSESDSRWNNSGEAVVHTLLNVEPMLKWIEECKQKYGDAPEDCTKEAWKI